jgi:hypothetical protein
MIITINHMQSSEVKSNKIHFDLDEIEYLINEEIRGKSFGSAVQHFEIIFNTYVLDGPFDHFFSPLNKKKGYRSSDKKAHATKQIDYSLIAGMDKVEQLEVIKNAFLEAIPSTVGARRKKDGFDFDEEALSQAVDRIITNYALDSYLHTPTTQEIYKSDYTELTAIHLQQH